MVYHASGEVVEFPEIRKSKYTKDFSWGFYCTIDFEQARKWAKRSRMYGTVNYYTYTENKELKILKFENMTDEWLDFIAACRNGLVHDYDIIEGPMAPTHQISFHTLKALDCLKFERSAIINE